MPESQSLSLSPLSLWYEGIKEVIFLSPARDWQFQFGGTVGLVGLRPEKLRLNCLDSVCVYIIRTEIKRLFVCCADQSYVVYFVVMYQALSLPALHRYGTFFTTQHNIVINTGTTQHMTTQHCTIQHNTIQHNTKENNIQIYTTQNNSTWCRMIWP